MQRCILITFKIGAIVNQTIGVMVQCAYVHNFNMHTYRQTRYNRNISQRVYVTVYCKVRKYCLLYKSTSVVCVLARNMTSVKRDVLIIFSEVETVFISRLNMLNYDVLETKSANRLRIFAIFKFLFETASLTEEPLLGETRVRCII